MIPADKGINSLIGTVRKRQLEIFAASSGIWTPSSLRSRGVGEGGVCVVDVIVSPNRQYEGKNEGQGTDFPGVRHEHSEGIETWSWLLV